MSKQVEQASGKSEYKCIFCGTITYFEDEGKAYCIDCYCKIRNSAHTHELPKNTPINPLPTVGRFRDDPYGPLSFPMVIC